MAIKFPKQYKSPEELAEMLSERGLIIINKDRACHYMRNIGYYRLSAYLYPFLAAPKTKQIFKQGSSFDSALLLYKFDKKLRLYLFNEIEKIEVSFRSALANIVACETNNMFWMTEGIYFADANKYSHTKELIDLELKRSREDFILHFRSKYSNDYPPAWMLVEILPLGVLTRIYENLKSNALKKRLAAYYNLPVPLFTSWLTVITLTRNSCCHHARVWNRKYAISPMIARKMKRPWISEAVPVDRVFYEICIIKWFVDIISPDNDLKSHLQYLLDLFPTVDLNALGIPSHWMEEPLWQK